MKRAALALAALAVPVAGHDPITTNLTWSREISRIVHRRCAGCHREGGAAPMPLVTYDDARPWAKAIRDEVLNRRMPPWAPVKGVGEYRDDASLSAPELDMIVGWVEGGAPAGDAIYLPPSPAASAQAAPPSRASAPRGKEVTVEGSLTLAAPLEVAAVFPGEVPEHGSFELAAVKPDGAVERLIWIRDFRARWNRSYALREPMTLPRGTRLLVFSGPGARATLTAATGASKPAR